MATLGLTQDLTIYPITRQTLYDMWSTATLSTLDTTSLSEDYMPIEVGTGISDRPSSPKPGQHYWDYGQQLMYVFFDEVDGTGASLWLACGPDRWEVAALCQGPIAAGGLVTLAYDRWITPYDPSQSPIGNALGCVQSNVNWPSHLTCPTNQSGAWVSVGVDGFMYGMFLTSSVSPNHYTYLEKKPAIPDQLRAIGGLCIDESFATPRLDRVGWNLHAHTPQSEFDAAARVLFLFHGFQKSRIVL
jgi:hypothetical protein